tara:strand:+ start:33635 stop:34393 length:759 start_codon:yes stop_codon:yes gene_type:complete
MFLPAPPDPARIAFLGEWRYAHRGLHEGRQPLENSLPAFQAAIDAGYGIECDVRLSADGVVYVFHDDTLDRLTGAGGRFSAFASDRLDAILLDGDNGSIPRLAALLARVEGRVPLLIEMKITAQEAVAPLCEMVRRALADYKGNIAVMSFDPRISRWFRKHAPHVPRGLVVTEEEARGMWGYCKRHLAMRYAHPDFLAYDIRDLPSPFATSARQAGFPVLSWTVRTADQWRTVAAYADAPIFEGSADATDGR